MNMAWRNLVRNCNYNPQRTNAVLSTVARQSNSFICTKPPVFHIRKRSVHDFNATKSWNDTSRSIEIERRKESLGLKVVPITPEMTNEVMDFMWDHFFQNEPLTASVEFKRGWFVDHLRYIPLLKKGDSFAALNRENELVGVYVGRQLSSTDRAAQFIDFIGPYIYIYGAQIVGSAKNLTRIIWLRKHLNYDPWRFMQERGTKKIFENSIIAVGKKWRGKGIGEVIKYEADKSLKDSGCAYTYTMYTSNLSTAISKHFDEEVISSALYQDLRDSSGRVLFPEHDEHTVISVRINKL